MMEFENTSEETRVWTTLQAPDGSTVELAPGERVKLTKDPGDPYLKPVAKPRKGDAKSQQITSEVDADLVPGDTEGQPATDTTKE